MLDVRSRLPGPKGDSVYRGHSSFRWECTDSNPLVRCPSHIPAQTRQRARHRSRPWGRCYGRPCPLPQSDPVVRRIESVRAAIHFSMQCTFFGHAGLFYHTQVLPAKVFPAGQVGMTEPRISMAGTFFSSDLLAQSPWLDSSCPGGGRGEGITLTGWLPCVPASLQRWVLPSPHAPCEPLHSGPHPPHPHRTVHTTCGPY